MTNPQTPNEWLRLFEQGIELMRQSPWGQNQLLIECLEKFLQSAKNLEMAARAHPDMAPAQFGAVMQLLRDTAESHLNAMELFCRITVDQFPAPPLPYSQLFKWKQGWNGFLHTLHKERET